MIKKKKKISHKIYLKVTRSSSWHTTQSSTMWFLRTEALLEHHADHERHHLDPLHLLGRRPPHGMGRLWLWAHEDLLHVGLHQRRQVEIFFIVERLQTSLKWWCNSQFFVFCFFFLVALNLQGLRDLHADPGGALPDLPSHHHAVVLRLHPQTLQEGPQPQGQCSMSASLFLQSQADTHPRCAEGLEILLLIGSKSWKQRF